MNHAQIRYLREVLGVEQILWGKLSIEAPLNHPRIAMFVSKMDAPARDLFNKMVAAMKLDSQDISVFEDPTTEVFRHALSKAPIVSLVFGSELAKQLEIEFTRGKFSNQEGVATIVTYGPSDLTKNPELKSETWKDMKLAMSRLGSA